MNPEAAVPLALGPAGAHFKEDQVLAVGFISRYRAVAAGPGSAAIGVQDTSRRACSGSCFVRGSASESSGLLPQTNCS
jgi:hypothetical protein